jgi:hypothetical protein
MQGRRHLLRTREALTRLAIHRPLDHASQSGVDVRANPGERRRSRIGDRSSQRHGVVVRERASTDEGLVTNHTNGVQVVGHGRRRAGDPLGAHVRHGSDDLTGHRVRHPRGLSDAEVGDFHGCAVRRHQDVPRFHVAVHDSGSMRHGQRAENLVEDRANALWR